MMHKIIFKIHEHVCAIAALRIFCFESNLEEKSYEIEFQKQIHSYILLSIR